MKQTIRVFWKIFFIGFAAFALLLLMIYMGVFGKLPSLSELENPTILQATEVYAADGTLMGKYFRDRGNRSNVDFRDISKHAINALVATEDERFYDHSGIDGKGVIRAVAFLGSKGGGSTITQQLALNMFSERARNPITRVIQKLKEWIIAIKLERNFTKQEILALYLNVVPFSDNMYGIRNASLTFFSKEPDRLNIEESAVLIGMVNGPTIFNPRRNPKSALMRRNHVITKMGENSFITEEEASKIKLKPIVLNYKRMDENTGLAPYFREVLRDDIKQWCKNNTNPTTGDPYDIYKDGLRIYTTINPRMQIYAEEAVAKHMPVLQKALNAQNSIKKGKVWEGRNGILETAMKNTDRWKNGQEDGMTDAELRASFKQKVPMKVFAWNSRRQKDTVMTPMDSIKYHRQMLQTSFMVMDPVTGEVKAWVGGIDFKTYKFDHVNINTKRQVGSAIKPFLYCQAIEEAGFTPETPVENVVQNFPGFGLVPAKGECKGNTVSMASALTYSMNCATAYIMKQIGPKRFVEFLNNINIKSKMDPYPSISLGAVDLSMFEMLYGYTMFANHGFSTKPTYITRIEDRNGNVLESFQTKMNQVISESSAYTTTKMLGGPVEIGTAAGLRSRLGAAEMAGKTGTTNDNADAWFIGFTPQLLGGTWIGADDRFIRLESGLGYGGQAARPIWETFFQKVYADKTLGIDKDARFAQPEQMREEALYDYMNIIDQTPPPGAEGEDQGNGAADQYMMEPDTNNVPVDSELDEEEQKVLKEANQKKDEKKNGKNPTTPPQEEKKKGLFRKIFGGKKDKEKDNEY
ncbi:transglycosylase domain-containing protein [Flavihumibacter sp. ZG627]|uniref:transglycosylase domain-containing protein n=1 Tax=Flavihumibacter sp. ZG627 TaxID=1463156 RepID=UPI00057ED191|nr:transglycosylase domain-containing protein [Flavihumibacter sp. ZG627]KIC91403.1 peptidoglycan glycosyltransferase [Flavihumibacter sp. ZG627]